MIWANLNRRHTDKRFHKTILSARPWHMDCVQFGTGTQCCCCSIHLLITHVSPRWLKISHNYFLTTRTHT